MKLVKSEEDKLAQTIALHINQIDTILRPRRELWTRYIGLYKAQRTDPEKSFPWPGCSNIFVPELFDRVSTAAAHIYGTTIRNDPPFNVRSEYGTPDDVKMAEDLEHFIRYYVRMVQHQDTYWRIHLPYLILLGTHVAKVQAVDTSPQGYPLVRIDPVNLHRFYAYPSIPRWREAPILADLSWISPGTIAQWVASGVLSEEKAAKLVQYDNDTVPRTDLMSENRVEPSSIAGGYVPIHDVYIRWQRGGMLSKPVLIRALFHFPTHTVLWTEDWADRPLPYQLVYWRRDEDSVFGIGMGDTMWTVQMAMNTAFNQAIDNATIANVRMFAAPVGSGLEPNEPIYPGKVLIGVNSDKIKDLRLGDIYPSALAIPAAVRQVMERNSAFNDTFMGMSDTTQKTRFTFAGAALNVQQGSMRIDYNSAEFEDGLIELVWTTLEALVKYNAGDTVRVPVRRKSVATIMKELLEEAPSVTPDLKSLLRAPLSEDEAAAIEEQMFRIPSTVLRRERFSIRPARREANSQVERQSAIVLAQLVAQYLRHVIELAQLTGSQELVAKTIPEVWKVANYAMRKVLVAFAVEESSEMVVDFMEVMNAINAVGPAPATGLGQVGGVVEGTGGTEQPGMGIDQGEGAMGLAGTPGGFLGGA